MSSKVTLKVTGGPMEGKEFVFEQHDTFVFGRMTDCHVRLAEGDQTASRYHFIVEVNPPDARIRDLGSRNGTYVNGRRHGGRTDGEPADAAKTREHPQVDLRHGDTITVGDHVFVVHVEMAETAAYQITPAMAAAAGLPPAPTPAPPQGARESPRAEPAPAPIAAQPARPPQGETICLGQPPPPAPPAPEEHRMALDEPAAVLLRHMVAEAAARQRQPPRGIAGFEIVRKLGHGGCGAVYLGRNREGLEVAIKVMVANVAVDPTMRAYFLREIAVMRSVASRRHPNLVQMFSEGCAGDAFFVIMEHCAGGSLWDLMQRRGGRVSLEEARPIMVQALTGLAEAHQLVLPSGHRGIVHRDLKPQNILLSARRGGIAKIADYGLAKDFQLSGLSGHTVTGAFAGTLEYMPREQVIDFKRTKPSTDVWSIAATFYHMLTGCVPREAPDGADPVMVVLQQPVIPLRNRDRSLPQELTHVIDKALSTNPADRYQNGGELLAALRRA